MQSGRTSLTEYTLRLALTLFIIILLLAMWRLRDALMLTFLAAIVAIALQMPVNRLQRMGLSRGTSVIASMAGLVLIITLFFVLLVPVFVTQIRDLVDELPDAVEQAREEYDSQVEKHDWLPKVDWDKITEGSASDFVMEQAGQLSRNIFPFLTGVGGLIANLIFVFFIALFFVTDPANYLEGLLALVPNGYRPRALEIFVQLGETLRRWFIGQLISMTMSGILIGLVTGVILGLPNPVALGMISGVMEFVPNFGSILSVIPGVLIALAKDPALAPWVVVAYLITQQIQSNVIMPRIMSRQVSMPAATVLIAQVLAAALFGFLGLLLAVPLAVVVMVLLREIYVFDVLNTRSAQIEVRQRTDGVAYPVVVTVPYRPARLTPGEAANLAAQGQDPFQVADGQIVEIITPVSPALEQTARSQQVVWVALLALVAAQGMALVRTLLSRQE